MTDAGVSGAGTQSAKAWPLNNPATENTISQRMVMNSTARGQNLPLHILYKQEMPANRCKHCEQPLVEIDHYGERLTGCPNCNRWQAATGEWCRLAADDIIALRAIKAATQIE
jgi:hypothetical protein